MIFFVGGRLYLPVRPIHGEAGQGDVILFDVSGLIKFAVFYHLWRQQTKNKQKKNKKALKGSIMP